MLVTTGNDAERWAVSFGTVMRYVSTFTTVKSIRCVPQRHPPGSEKSYLVDSQLFLWADRELAAVRKATECSLHYNLELTDCDVC